MVLPCADKFITLQLAMAIANIVFLKIFFVVFLIVIKVLGWHRAVSHISRHAIEFRIIFRKVTKIIS
jgi:hypothetical protein